MDKERYSVFGLGLTSSDLLYVGWTADQLDQTKRALLNELKTNNHPLSQCAVGGDGTASIFEIESFTDAEEAKTAVAFWRTYYSSLGLELIGRIE